MYSTLYIYIHVHVGPTVMYSVLLYILRDANIYDLGVIYTIYSPRLRLYDPHMIFYDFPRFYVNKIKCVQFVLHVVS